MNVVHAPSAISHQTTTSTQNTGEKLNAHTLSHTFSHQNKNVERCQQESWMWSMLPLQSAIKPLLPQKILGRN